jgi:hypothetical protein
MNFSQGNHKLRLKNVYERENPIKKKIAKMTVTDHNSAVQLLSSQLLANVPDTLLTIILLKD